MEKELKNVIEETQLRNVFWGIPKQMNSILKYISDVQERLTKMNVLPEKGSKNESDSDIDNDELVRQVTNYSNYLEKYMWGEDKKGLRAQDVSGLIQIATKMKVNT